MPFRGFTRYSIGYRAPVNYAQRAIVNVGLVAEERQCAWMCMNVRLQNRVKTTNITECPLSLRFHHAHQRQSRMPALPNQDQGYECEGGLYGHNRRDLHVGQVFVMNRARVVR